MFPSTEKETMKEKRREPRIPTERKAHYFLKDSTSTMKECTLIDVSHRGMGIRFNTSEELSPGSTVIIDLTGSVTRESLYVTGLLRWIEEGVNFSIGGIELLESLDDITLLKLL
jgi:hypothetical protein